MEYVPRVLHIGAVLERHGLPRLDPYAFDTTMIDDMIDLLVDSPALKRKPDPCPCCPRPIGLGLSPRRLLGRA